MAKFMIECSTTRSYWVIVEAPDGATALEWYDGCDGDEFHGGDHEDGWQLDECYELSLTDGYPVDFEFVEGKWNKIEQPSVIKIEE